MRIPRPAVARARRFLAVGDPVVEERLARAEARARMAARRQLSPARGPGDRSALNPYELSVYSQNGEDGILDRLFSLIGTETASFVEFGVGDGSECNGAFLALHRGWKGLMIEGDPDLARSAQSFFAQRSGEVAVANDFVTVDNIDGLLRGGGFGGPLDLLSVDIDGNDYWVLEAITVEARVVVVEYNASFGPTEAVTVPYDPAFVRPRENRLYHGASLAALERLNRSRGYRLVGCDSLGVNAFFLQSDLGADDVLPTLTPEQAWYPHWTRTRRLSQRAQEESLAPTNLIRV